MKFTYHMCYEDTTDTFFAYVDDGADNTKPIYQIDNSEEMSEYIKTGKMKHIDDIAGLAEFLKEQGILSVDDTVIMAEEYI